jgi:pyrimidine deaminase RibD-like protein
MKLNEFINEDPSDYEIRNYHKLDRILVKLCAMVVKGMKDPREHYYGMVAACVLDPDNRMVAGLNTFDDGTDTRKHAERVAIERYQARHGDIPEGSIIITTCSPCSEEMGERFGIDCTELVDQVGVKKVYCGYIDPTQEEADRDFNIMETENGSIRDLCKSFAATFTDDEAAELEENFADGRHPEDKGDSKRYHVPTKASVSTLRRVAKQGGRKGQLAHWMANMKAGRAKHESEHVSEGFDQPYPLKWEKSEYGDIDALAKLSDGSPLSIMFNLADMSENDWGVEFYRNNSQLVTGEGDAQRVFATVLTAIGKFIKKKKPDTLFFSAVKEEDPTGSRTKLYDRLVQRYATGLGYNLKKVDYPEQTGYKLTRKEQVASTP